VESSKDFSHLNALEYRLHNENKRLTQATTPREKEWRQVIVDQIKKEIAHERTFLGLPEQEPPVTLSDDELLKELGD